MTMSSGFLESLGAYCQCSISGKPGGPAEGRDGGDKTYTSLSPELGLMCLRMDPTRSVAMISVFAGYRVPSENQTKMKIGYGKRRVKMNSKREGKRRCATGKSGGSPSPINTKMSGNMDYSLRPIHAHILHRKTTPGAVWGSCSVVPPNRETAVGGGVASNRLAAVFRLWRASDVWAEAQRRRECGEEGCVPRSLAPPVWGPIGRY